MKPSKRLGNRLMVFGGSGMAISILISIVTLFSTYNKVGSTCGIGSGNECKIATEQIASKLAVVLLFVSFVSLIVGIAIRLSISIRPKS